MEGGIEPAPSEHIARQVKPQVPLTGNDGVPLRDMWELEKQL